VEGFGEFNYIFAFYYFFLAINDFGVNIVAVREISKDRAQASEIIGALLPLRALQAVIAVVVALFKRKTIAFDATTLEAHGVMRSIARRTRGRVISGS